MRSKVNFKNFPLSESPSALITFMWILFFVIFWKIKKRNYFMIRALKFFTVTHPNVSSCDRWALNVEKTSGHRHRICRVAWCYHLLKFFRKLAFEKSNLKLAPICVIFTWMCSHVDTKIRRGSKSFTTLITAVASFDNIVFCKKFIVIRNICSNKGQIDCQQTRMSSFVNPHRWTLNVCLSTDLAFVRSFRLIILWKVIANINTL